MPEPVEADLQLSFDSALSELQSFGATIESTLEGAAAAGGAALGEALSGVPPLDLEADTSGIAEEVQGAFEGLDVPAVPVDADVAPALEALDEVSTAAEDLAPVVEVEADTTAAQEAIDELGDSAAGATASTDGLGGSVKGLGGAAGGLATGSVAGLGSAVGEMGGKAGLAVGAVVGVAGAVGLMVSEATEALGAQQRFNAVLGQSADAVEHLRNIDGLNTNLSDLALTLGSDDDRIREVAARMFELATASGKTRGEASLFTQELIAMGARAVAINPNLGDVGDVTESLSTAFVRGGRFAAKYGLDLNAADINQRALAMSGKESVAELSFVEKAMAGAAIASEKYGGNLDQVVARGAENAITQQRRLKQTIIENIEAIGGPLVFPAMDVLEESIPIFESVGRVLGILAKDTLPLIAVSAEIIAPPLELLADVLDAVPGPIAATAIGVGILLPLMGAYAGSAGVAATTSTLWASALTFLNAELAVTSITAKQAVPIVGALFAGIAIGKAIFPVVQSGLEELGVTFGKDWTKAAKEADDQTKVVIRTFGKDLPDAFDKLVDKTANASDVVGNTITQKLAAFKRVAEESTEDAIRLRDGLHLTKEETAAFNVVLDQEAGKQRDKRAAAQEAERANADLAASYRTPIEAVGALVDALEEEKKILEELENRLLGLPGAAENYANAVRDQAEAQNDYNAAVAQYGRDSAEARTAALRLDSANADVASSALEFEAAQGELNTAVGDAGPEGVQREIDKLRDLQAKYPEAAGAIQPFIDKLVTQRDLLLFLASLPPIDINVGITVEGETSLQQVVDNLNRLPEDVRVAIALGYAAEGAAVPARPGGTPYIVGEAGHAEAILSAGNTPAQNMALLARAGIALPPAPAGAYAGMRPWEPQVAPAGPQHVDNSVHTQVDARGQEDPTRIGIALSRRQRADLNARSGG